MPLLAPPDTPHDIPRSIQTAGGRATAINIHCDYFTSRRIIHAVLIGVCLLVHQVGADAPSAAARIAFAMLDVIATATLFKLEATSATTGVGLPIVSCEHLIGSRILPPRLRLTHTAARIAGVWLSAYLAAEAAIAKINPYGAIDVGSSPLAAQLAGLRMAAIGALAGSLSLPTIAKVPLLIGCGGLSLVYVNCGSLMGAITSLSFLIVAFAAAHADEAQFVARRLTETTSPRDEPARAIDPPPHGVYVGRGRGRRPYIPPEAPPAPVTPIRPLYENPDLGRLLASAVVTAWSAPAEASAPSPSSVADDDPASPHTMGAATESIPRFMRNLLAGVELHRALAKEIRGAKCSHLAKIAVLHEHSHFHPPSRTVLPRIKPSELQIRHKIGEGSFSVVYAATWNGVLVAEKRLKLHRSDSSQRVVTSDASDPSPRPRGEPVLSPGRSESGRVESQVTAAAEALRLLVREATALSALRHPNCISILGVTIAREHYSLVTEVMEGGSVSVMIAHLAASLEISDVTRVFILLSASYGMAYLHANGILRTRERCRAATQCPNQSRSHSVAQTATSNRATCSATPCFIRAMSRSATLALHTLSSYKLLHNKNPPHPSRKPPRPFTAAPLAGRRRRSSVADAVSHLRRTCIRLA